MDKKDEAIMDAMHRMFNEKDLQIVNLQDKLNLGCNKCGDCCCQCDVSLTPFDFFRMSHVVSPEEAIGSVDLHIEKSGVYRLMLKTFDNGMCIFSHVNNNGEFECKLGDNKPLICYNPFIAVTTAISSEVFDIVPEDEEVSPIDIDRYLEENRVESKTLLFCKGRFERNCGVEQEEELTVEEHLKEWIKYQDENNLALLLTMLPLRYVPLDKLERMLIYADKSKCNLFDDILNVADGEKKDITPWTMVTHFLYNIVYFFFDPKADIDFKDYIIKHIRNVEKTKLQFIRILYKYLVKVLGIADPNLFDQILEEEDTDVAQEMFDNYYTENMKEISETFISEVPNMLDELQKAEKKGNEE